MVHVYLYLIVPFLVVLRFGCISGEFGRAMVRVGETLSSQNTRSETRPALHASEANKKGTIRYLPYPNGHGISQVIRTIDAVLIG